MSVSPVQSMASLSSDLCYDILRRLDGATLASAACACAAFCSISKEEKLWENVCCSMWPSTNSDDVKSLISSVGGFKKFYADCFPLIVNKEVPEFHWNNYHHYPREWTEDEYYGDEDEVENISPSDFVSIVDIRYKDKTICSKVLWGIPNANGSNGWFYNCPFRIDLLAYSARDENPVDEVMLSISDGLPPVWSMEQERKDGKLWQELRDGIRLSWILVNSKTKKAANLSSWSPIGGQRHWPTDKDFLIRFGSVLPAKDILPCQVVECIIIMKFKVVHTEDENSHTTLKFSELSMQLGDMEGSHVNGRNSLLVLKEALSCPRSKNYSEALESCHLYSKVQSELKEEKMRYENRYISLLSGAVMMMHHSIYSWLIDLDERELMNDDHHRSCHKLVACFSNEWQWVEYKPELQQTNSHCSRWVQTWSNASREGLNLIKQNKLGLFRGWLSCL